MNRSLAALDLGSNSVKLLLARAGQAQNLIRQNEYCLVTRLAEGVAATGRLQPAAMARTLAAVQELLTRLPRTSPGHGQGIAVATSAVRDAGNRDEFLDACHHLLGATPRILSGQEEAETVFRGAVSDQASARACICLDIGGGSTELAAGRPGDACQFRTSLDLGCVRLAEQFGLFEIAAPAALAAARAAVRARVQPAGRDLAAGVRALGPHPHLLASGGTATTFAAAVQGVRRFTAARIHGTRHTEQTVAEWVTLLASMSVQDRAALPGIPADRAPVLPAGLLILSETLRGLALAEFTVTVRGLRYGLLLRLATGELPPTWTWDG